MLVTEGGVGVAGTSSLKKQVACEGEVCSFEFLAQLGLSLVVLLSLGGLLLQGANLVLDAGAELHELPDVSLYHDEGHALFLQFLVGLAADVASDPRLQPRDDLGQAVVTDFLEGTQHTSAEEYLTRGEERSGSIKVAVNSESIYTCILTQAHTDIAGYKDGMGSAEV
ncbi:hypothetical protein E2C01_026615 [Portunus trituberculatus]|uniref:Uncharacterized protein n=1 Tax=Portunus trituberculatus TaxID=210409 RepID=A0A5B7EFU4_PORTR|nr:hypothetical protein [Portunus trituberculatus]